MESDEIEGTRKTWGHANNFKSLRQMLPALDKAIYTLVTDLHERGLDKDVTVVVWGEYGRTPKINSNAARGAACRRLLHPPEFAGHPLPGSVRPRSSADPARPQRPADPPVGGARV